MGFFAAPQDPGFRPGPRFPFVLFVAFCSKSVLSCVSCISWFNPVDKDYGKDYDKDSLYGGRSVVTSGIQNPGSRDALLEQIRDALENRLESLRTLADDHHPVDIADALQDLPSSEIDRVLEAFDTDKRAEVVSHIADMDEGLTEQFVEDHSVEELAEIVDEMDPDDAVDLLEVADDEKAEAVIKQLGADDAEEIRELRSFEPDSAGGIMTTEFLWARPDETPQQIIDHLKLESDDVETVQRIMVCAPDMRLLGEMKAKDFLTAEPDQAASTLMDRGLVQVVASTDQEVCANLMRKYDLAVLPVVNESNKLLGIITHDDILDVMEDEAEEDMFRLVGVGDSKPLEHGAAERALKRLPWLTTTLVGMGLIGPLILHKWFEATLDQVVVLAFFIPAIMGLSGNTATQSATITVRGLATGEIQYADLFWMLKRELRVALIIAVVCALTMMLFAYAVTSLGFSEHTSFSIGHVTSTVGISMFAGILVAVVLGTSIPMFCHRAGVDPAVASGPFITTLIDITTQVIYLALATWLLLG